MDIFFNDPNIVRLPPEEVRLREVQIAPQPESGRVKIHLELTPFQKRPNLSMIITSSTGKEAAHTTILETMLTKLELTIHLRSPEPGSEYTLETIVFYQKLPQPREDEVVIQLPEPMVVDRRKSTFILAESSL
jgi:hypothetical protein